MSAFLVAPHLTTSLATVLRPSSYLRSLRCALVPPLPPSVATIDRPDSKSTIHIVGCVHGSQVSAEDVCTLLDTTNPHTVVLELCPSRLTTLQTIFSDPTPPRKRPRSLSTLSKVFGGIGPALVAYVLESIYVFQSLAGMTPGIEFRHPITQPLRWRLVCADIPARDTVRRLHRSLLTPWQSIRVAGEAAADLLTRILTPPRGGLRVTRLFLREGRRMRELVRILGPVGAVGIVVGLVGNAAAAVLEGGVVGSRGVMSGWEIMGQVGAALYVTVSALRFIRVLVGERDAVMAQKVLECAREGGKGSVVCVVVGLLHVNGIVRLIHDALDKENGGFVQ